MSRKSLMKASTLTSTRSEKCKKKDDCAELELRRMVTGSALKIPKRTTKYIFSNGNYLLFRQPRAAEKVAQAVELLLEHYADALRVE